LLELDIKFFFMRLVYCFRLDNAAVLVTKLPVGFLGLNIFKSSFRSAAFKPYNTIKTFISYYIQQCIPIVYNNVLVYTMYIVYYNNVLISVVF